MNKNDVKSCFFRSMFISKLAPTIQDHLYSNIELIILSSGQYLHRKNDEFTGIFCLLNGKLKATGVTLEGTEYSLAHVMPGAVIGEIAYLDDGLRTHDAKAIENSTLARLSKPVLDNTCRTFPEFHSAIVKLACLHIRQSFSVVDDFLTLSPEQRLAKKLLSMTITSNGQHKVHINQQDLGAWIGISRQSINKILSKWQKAGWIDIAYRQLNILSAQDLRQLYAS